MKKIHRRSDTTYGETKPRSISKDRKLLSSQKHEIRDIAAKYGKPQWFIRELQDKVGVSRRAVEAELLRLEIYPVKKRKKTISNKFKRQKQ